jgi:predicted RNA binding protein YcfA (HicA-like mRNA interferase family)
VNKLNSRQKKILEDIFKEPVKSDVLWKDIEKVLIALGAEISEGKGSRVRIYLNGIRAVFHRPHPGKQTDRGALKSMRRFLIEAGVRNVKI